MGASLHAHAPRIENRGANSQGLDALRARILERGVNPLLYWAVRAVLQPLFLIYFRLGRIGYEHLPRRGPLLLAANHRSFLDPFSIGMLVRRPVYYMAKRELFQKRWQAWLLARLGAFPVDRGAGDAEAMETARAILRRGDCVVIFPEGTRVRSGPLGHPRRPFRPAARGGARGLSASARRSGRAARARLGCAMSERTTRRQAQGPARRRVLRALPRTPARRLQLCLLPRRRPSRCRGPHRADLPAGLPPLRARTARVARAPAASLADPHRAQPCRQPLSRPLAPAGLFDRRHPAAECSVHHRAARRGPRRAQPDSRR